MASDWREIFDRTFCTRVRDEVWKLLPNSLTVRVRFEGSELAVEIERRVVTEYFRPEVDPFAKRKIRGFRFMLPPIESWEAQAWLDGLDGRLPTIIGAIAENLPDIIKELTDDATGADR